VCYGVRGYGCVVAAGDEGLEVWRGVWKILDRGTL